MNLMRKLQLHTMYGTLGELKMNKPIKPKKPSNRDPQPTTVITVSKLLVYSRKDNKYLLLDEHSHPNVFRDPEDKIINNELVPYLEELYNLDCDWDMNDLSFGDYQRIYRDCNIPADDFTVCHRHNEDGYYDMSIVQYKIVDPDYDAKLEKYNNRFVEYEKQLAVYEEEMKKYTEYKNTEKKKKLMAELNKL